MRHLFATTVALAAQALAAPIPFAHVADGVARDKLLADANLLVSRWGHMLHEHRSPAELDRKARQRRRARQTHPGKRGRP